MTDNRDRFDWSEDNIDLMKRLWASGLTGSQIAARMGTTRSSVIGKVHRLHLPKRATVALTTPRRQPPAQIPSLAVLSEMPNEPEPQLREPVTETVTPVKRGFGPCKTSDLQMGDHRCRWPVGDPRDKDFHFCGDEQKPGKPYCEKHCAVAYAGTTPGKLEPLKQTTGKTVLFGRRVA